MTPEDTIIFGTPGSGGFDEVPGAQVGPYKLISPLGEGGFGSVWLAERRHPFVQRVALKLVKAGMDSKAVVARFDQERQALAVMNHPGIAKVFDGGLTAQGRPYFAMEYVKGEPITEFCDRVKLSIDERLKLFEQACEAVQHAHLKGIVHRDLKPGNVLAFMVEGEGAKLKVIDFGVAKAMSQRMTEHTIFTETGQMIGTPEYMSPEQADPTGGDIDTRSDIYSLGVLLYELLVGATPFDGKELRKKAYGEIQRTIREQDPPSPSARLSTISTKDQATITRIESARKLRASDLVRRLRGELEWIPQKAMRKEPQHRYQSAMALAEDVRNYLQGKPIAAAPESSAYRMRKYVRRNRGLVMGAGAVLAALGLGLGATAWAWQKVVDARLETEAVRARETLQAAAPRMSAEPDAPHSADEMPSAAGEDARGVAGPVVGSPDPKRDYRAVMAVNEAIKAKQTNRDTDFEIQMETLRSLGQERRFELMYAVAESDQSTDKPLGQHKKKVRSVAFSSTDGSTIASASDDATIILWDAKTGKLRKTLDGHNDLVTSVAFSPDGTTLASGSFDTTVCLWETKTGTLRKQLLGLPTQQVCGVAFSRDGSKIASANQDGTIVLWDAKDFRRIRSFVGHTEAVNGVAFSPDGKRIASGSDDGTVRVWDIENGQKLLELSGHSGPINRVAFSRDGRIIASASGDKCIRLWDAESGKLRTKLSGHDDAVTSVAFSFDGKFIVSASFDKTIRLWSTETDTPLRTVFGNTAQVYEAAFSPDGKWIVSGSADGKVCLWYGMPEHTGYERLRAREGGVRSVAFSRNWQTIVSGGVDKSIRLWDTAIGRAIGAPLPGHDSEVMSVAISPDGKQIASGSLDWTIRLWGNTVRVLKGHSASVFSIAFSRDGKKLVSGSADKTVRVWNVATGEECFAPLSEHRGSVLSVAFSPDGSKIASAGADGEILLWDAESRVRIRAFVGHEKSVRGVAFSPDGGIIASASDDKTIRLWDTATGSPLGEPLNRHKGSVNSVAFSPDGRTIASGSFDKTIRLWDTATGSPLGEPLNGHTESVNSVAFSPDGRALASGGDDKSVLIWHAVPMYKRIGQIRICVNLVDEARAALSPQLAAFSAGSGNLADLQRFALNDPRFAGENAIAALIVVGEVWDEQVRRRLAEPVAPPAP
ncbi:MAG: serine/threonine protein kinase [Planctomycetota bacterium]|nr:serine/threonine protein kinase [Planctomycetota bacterium]